MLAELAFRERIAAAADRTQVLADARLADINAVEADLDRAVVGEQIRGLFPQAAIGVVAVGGLQPLDGVDVFDSFLALLERRDASLERRGLRDVFRARSAAAAAKRER